MPGNDYNGFFRDNKVALPTGVAVFKRNVRAGDQNYPHEGGTMAPIIEPVEEEEDVLDMGLELPVEESVEEPMVDEPNEFEFSLGATDQPDFEPEVEDSEIEEHEVEERRIVKDSSEDETEEVTLEKADLIIKLFEELKEEPEEETEEPEEDDGPELDRDALLADDTEEIPIPFDWTSVPDETGVVVTEGGTKKFGILLSTSYDGRLYQMRVKTEDGYTKTLTDVDLELISAGYWESLSWNELRKLAKQYGVKARSKQAIYDALDRIEQ